MSSGLFPKPDGKECALKLRELGQAAGGLDYVSVSVAIKRFAHRLQHDLRLAQLTKEVRESL